jgi:hypothetical protein
VRRSLGGGAGGGRLREGVRGGAGGWPEWATGRGRQRDEGEDWEVKLEPPVNRVLPAARGERERLEAAFGGEGRASTRVGGARGETTAMAWSEWELLSRYTV